MYNHVYNPLVAKYPNPMILSVEASNPASFPMIIALAKRGKFSRAFLWAPSRRFKRAAWAGGRVEDAFSMSPRGETLWPKPREWRATRGEMNWAKM